MEKGFSVAVASTKSSEIKCGTVKKRLDDIEAPGVREHGSKIKTYDSKSTHPQYNNHTN
jgi:hypothetical protein